MAIEKKAVAFFVYNRPQITFRTFRQILSYSPKKIFIISDGPKLNETDRLKVESVRQIINNEYSSANIDYLYRNENLGCRESIVSGLKWVFNQVEECIILEDDCYPDLSFFNYCAELLSFYKSNEKVMSIGGYRPEKVNHEESSSYHFSNYPSIWGWATWRRAFEGFDPSLTDWSEREGVDWLSQYLGDIRYARYWAYMLNARKNGANDWDYAWAHHCWRRGGVAIRPRNNLIQNIGFGGDATHTHEEDHPFSKIVASSIPLPLIHPKEISLSSQKEQLIENLVYSGTRTRQLLHFRKMAKEKCMKGVE